jgi:tetratricopeptide (TPR) repeat protein
VEFCVACSSFVDTAAPETSAAAPTDVLERAGQAMAADPNDGETYHQLGDHYRQRGELALAAQAYKQALKRTPASADLIREKLDATIDAMTTQTVPAVAPAPARTEALDVELRGAQPMPVPAYEPEGRAFLAGMTPQRAILLALASLAAVVLIWYVAFRPQIRSVTPPRQAVPIYLEPTETADPGTDIVPDNGRSSWETSSPSR